MTDPFPDPFGEPCGPWRAWYAWRPVRLYRGRWVWRQWIRRRAVKKHEFIQSGPDRWWQYNAF